jgi:hypothetical protein
MSKFRCPESTGPHGPADAYGRCPWCGTKYTSTAPRPEAFDETDLTDAYEEFYDPDHGSRTWQQIQARYRMGQA